MSPNELLTLFLDTTPRQWGHRIAQLIPQPRITWNPPKGLWMGVSLGLHILAASALALSQLTVGTAPSTSLSSPEAVTVEIRNIAPVKDAVEPVFDENSDIVMAVSKNHMKHVGFVDRLFQKYSRLKTRPKKQTERALEKDDRVWKVHGTGVAGLLPAPVELSRKVQLKDASHTVQLHSSNQEIIRYLAGFKRRFRGCYERALLADSSVNGKVEFVMTVGNGGKVAGTSIRFKGKGLPVTTKGLEKCLTSITHDIRFPSRLQIASGQSFRFYAVLSL